MTPDDDDRPISPDHIIQAHGIADDDEPTPRPTDGDDPFAALLGGGDAGLDFGALMEQASNLQAQLLAAQALAADAVVEGVAGGGAVRIEVTGGHEFRSVTIRPDAVDPDDVEMLQDLVLAALHDAAERISELQAGSVDLKSMGLDGLFGSGS
jgi:DNA-binding YbaB/EbfC family protein